MTKTALVGKLENGTGVGGESIFSVDKFTHSVNMDYTGRPNIKEYTDGDLTVIKLLRSTGPLKHSYLVTFNVLFCAKRTGAIQFLGNVRLIHTDHLITDAEEYAMVMELVEPLTIEVHDSFSLISWDTPAEQIRQGLIVSVLVNPSLIEKGVFMQHARSIHHLDEILACLKDKFDHAINRFAMVNHMAEWWAKRAIEIAEKKNPDRAKEMREKKKDFIGLLRLNAFGQMASQNVKDSFPLVPIDLSSKSLDVLDLTFANYPIFDVFETEAEKSMTSLLSPLLFRTSTGYLYVPDGYIETLQELSRK